VKKTGKSILTLIILLILLGGLIAGYLILKDFNSTQTKEEDSAITLLGDCTAVQQWGNRPVLCL